MLVLAIVALEVPLAASFADRVDAEVRSQQQPDDESADALRAAAPEARAEILEPVPLR